MRTECARPRAQQRGKDGWRGIFECDRSAHAAAPEDGRTPMPDFSNRLSGLRTMNIDINEFRFRLKN
jgi:hypothetical protein